MDVIVVDFGSEQWKVGWSGKVPTILPSPANAVRGGLITSWDAFRSGLMRVFALLTATPEESNLLYVVPAQFPESSLHQLRHVSFETGVRSVRCMPAPPLALCSEGASSGIVIDIGATKTSLTAVYEGAIQDYAATTTPCGGKLITDKVISDFQELHHVPISTAEATAIIQQHGYVAANPKALQEIIEKGKAGALPPVMWSRRPGERYDVSGIVVDSCEALFTSHAGLALGALVHNVVAKIFSADFKSYSTIVSTVVLCGGVADCKGLVDRMKYELRPWPKLQIASMAQRKGVYKCWYGAAQLASLPNYLAECTMRNAYSPLEIPAAARHPSPVAAPAIIPFTSAGPVTPVVELPPLAAVPAPMPAPGPDTPKTKELKELREQQDAMRSELQELKKGVEWDKLKTDSQMVSFKADIELATLRTGHEVAKTVRAAQQEAVAESRRQARAHVGLVEAVAAAKAGSTEELQKIVQELRSDAEVARKHQMEREESLASVLRQKVSSDGSEMRQMAESVMKQAEETRKQQAESEDRLLGVLQCLLNKQEREIPLTGNTSAGTGTSRYISPRRTPRSVMRSMSPALPSISASPQPPQGTIKYGATAEVPQQPPQQQAQELFPSPPPPESSIGSPAASPLRGREGQLIVVKEGDKTEEGILVGPYEGANSNLIGKDLWWVRINNIKKLKPGYSLVGGTVMTGVQKVIDFIDSDLSPRSLGKLKTMRQKLDGKPVSTPTEALSEARSDASTEVPLHYAKKTIAPPSTETNFTSPSFQHIKPLDAHKQYEHINPPRPRAPSPQDDKYVIPPVDFPTASTHQDFPSACMRRTAVQCTRVGSRHSLPDGTLQGPKYAARDGWSRQWIDHPAMPGVGVDSACGKDVTVKTKWFSPLSMPHGGLHKNVPRPDASLFDGPGLNEAVCDAAGLPSSPDSLTAAKWKVNRLSRVDESYRIENQTAAVPANKPRPRTIPCSAMSSPGRPSLWRNLLSKVEGSAPDPLLRRSVTDVRTYAASLKEEVAEMTVRGKKEGDRMRDKTPARPWEARRDATMPEEETEPSSMKFSTDPFAEGMSVPATAVMLYAWVSEWETQVKIACPWDKKLVVHRCTAELPWVLEQQWNSPEAAQELVKDCIEDFYEMAKKKSYIKDKLTVVVHMNGFWAQRRGIVQGLNDMRSTVDYSWVADITPIPVHETELLFPVSAPAPKVASFTRRIGAEDGHESNLGGSIK